MMDVKASIESHPSSAGLPSRPPSAPRSRPGAAGVLAVVLMVVSNPGLGSDWPQWRGPGLDGHAPAVEEGGFPAGLPDDLDPVWRVPVGFGLGSPVVSGGRVFLLLEEGGVEVLRSFEAAGGATVWSEPVDAVFKDGQSAPGPRSTPTVAGGLVFVSSCRGEFQARRAAGGGLVWRTNFNDDFGAEFIGERGGTPGALRHGNTGGAVPDGGELLVPVGGSEGDSLVCFKRAGGEVVWKALDDPAGYAPPVVADLAGVRQVVYFTAEGAVGVGRARGDLLWRIPVKTSYGRHAVTPVIHPGSGTVVLGSHQSGLLGIRVKREGSGGRVSAEVEWTNKAAAMNFASPVAVGDHLYGLGPKGDVVCVEIPTGKRLWAERLVPTSPGKAYAGFIVLGKNILALTDGGELVFFAADPSGYQEISRAQACGKTWCLPAYAGGSLYLRDRRYLYRFALGAK